MKRFLIFWIVSGFLELPLSLAAAGQEIFLLSHPFWSLIFHLSAALLLGWSGGRVFLVLTLFLPVVGWLLSGILFWQNKNFSLRAVLEEEDWMMVGVKSKPPSPKLKKRRERILQELDLLPLADIMAGDDLELKRGAVDRLIALKTLEAVALLQNYRRDSSMDVRFFVTTALAKIKRGFQDEIDAVKEAMQKDIYKLEPRLHLAQSYLRYARSGLLDQETAQSFVGEALHHLQFSAMAEAAPEEVFSTLIEIHSEQKDWEKVLEVIAMLEARTGDGAKELAAKTNALFHLGRHAEVTPLLSQGRTAQILAPELRPVADWWMG